jgi:hypothetical protein
MGIAVPSNKNIPTIIDVLYSDHDIDTDLFAICLAHENGLMTIGGYNATIHTSEV